MIYSYQGIALAIQSVLLFTGDAVPVTSEVSPFSAELNLVAIRRPKLIPIGSSTAIFEMDRLFGVSQVESKIIEPGSTETIQSAGIASNTFSKLRAISKTSAPTTTNIERVAFRKPKLVGVDSRVRFASPLTIKSKPFASHLRFPSIAPNTVSKNEMQWSQPTLQTVRTQAYRFTIEAKNSVSNFVSQEVEPGSSDSNQPGSNLPVSLLVQTIGARLQRGTSVPFRFETGEVLLRPRKKDLELIEPKPKAQPRILVKEKKS